MMQALQVVSLLCCASTSTAFITIITIIITRRWLEQATFLRRDLLLNLTSFFMHCFPHSRLVYRRLHVPTIPTIHMT
jgi:hypothetical protein